MIRLAAFNAAWYQVEQSLLGGGDSATTVRIPTSWAVIQHQAGVVLIDTGVDLSSTTNEPAALADGAPLAACGIDTHASLRTLGIGPADIEVVINTHLHIDHVGQNLRYPQARFLARRAEVDYARAPVDPVLATEYPKNLIALDTLRYEPIEGDADVDLFGDGTVTLLSTPGHSAGHQSVLVRLAHRRSVLLAGDAVWTAACRDDPSVVPGLIWSRDAYRLSRSRLVDIAARENARWLFTHEPSNFGKGGWASGQWVT